MNEQPKRWREQGGHPSKEEMAFYKEWLDTFDQ